MLLNHIIVESMFYITGAPQARDDSGMIAQESRSERPLAFVNIEYGLGPANLECDSPKVIKLKGTTDYAIALMQSKEDNPTPENMNDHIYIQNKARGGVVLVGAKKTEDDRQSRFCV